MRINISFKKGLGRAKVCAVLENGKKNFSESRITYRKISVGCVVAEKQSLCDVQDEIHSTLPLYDISARAENLGKKAPERQSLPDVQKNPNQSISSSNIPAEIEAISENPAEKQSLIGFAKKIVTTSFLKKLFPRSSGILLLRDVLRQNVTSNIRNIYTIKNCGSAGILWLWLDRRKVIYRLIRGAFWPHLVLRAFCCVQRRWLINQELLL